LRHHDFDVSIREERFDGERREHQLIGKAQKWQL
jgi:hypothetical protein